MTIKLRTISLGAGVQSTTMALMATRGELTPMPDYAIFADTGDEPAPVYKHLEWLMSPGVLAFPVVIVTERGRKLGDEILKATRGESIRGSHARPPFFVANPDGSLGQVHRQCTGDYKIVPIEREIRRLLGLKFRQRWPKTPQVEQWIGISLDEIIRMKPSRIPTIQARWPLVEKRLSRSDCLLWMERHGFPQPPKSACTFCPFRSNEQWRQLKASDPAGWDKAVEVDAAIRTGLRGYGLGGKLYVHADRVPLDQVDLSSAADRGQLDLFMNDCSGMCGV